MRTPVPSFRIVLVAAVAIFVAQALTFAQSGNSRKTIDLVAEGRKLFFNATFGGNGRTCGTCHRAENELTIDAAFIATLPPTDPLFAGDSKNLPPFDPLNPNRPAFEDPVMLSSRALILENINGFGLDADGLLLSPPVFRAPPSLFNLSSSAPYGLSNCCATLQIFTTAAVIQHFTKTLNRVPGVDFVLPTAAELKALEAFMLSNASPANGNFKIAGRNSLLSAAADPKATDTTRAEIRGRDLFESIGCTTCHLAPVGAGGALNADTGMERFEHDPGHRNQTPTIDSGDGLGQFQIPPIFGLRKRQFFHSGLVGNNTVAISAETLRFTNLRDAVAFYVSPAFTQSSGALLAPGLATMTPGDISDIAHFLEAISKP